MLEDFKRKYEADTIRLAKLITIKFSDTASLINEYMIIRYGQDAVDYNDPTTWKYYLHLAGEYHPKDEIMTIYSLDTAESIVFSKELLALHDNTRLTYQKLGVEYYQLVDRYPEQESLIRGILFPCDIEEAIAAENGTILTYPEDLVEEREVTLIEELGKWIKGYLVRWNVQSFMTTDTYYVAAYQAVLYLNIVQRLFNLRNRRIHTNEVHSFHVRAFLASHGHLDIFYDYLTERQRLFLYRNLRYIERHNGIKPVFKLLVDRLLTERQIPIAEYTARQYQGFDNYGYPNYRYRKSPLNTQYNVPEKDYYSLKELSDKERPLAVGNSDEWDDKFSSMEKKFQNSGHAVMMTKDLESFMYDYSDAVPHTLEEIMVNEWLYTAYTQQYKSVINVNNPTKTAVITMTTDEAIIYYMYLACHELGIETPRIPKIMAYSISRLHDQNWTGIADIAQHSGLYERQDIATMLYRSLPIVPDRFYSTQQFNEYTRSLYEARVSHWIFLANVGDISDHGSVAVMINRMFFDVLVDFDTHPIINPDGLDMEAWLSKCNLPTDDFSSADRKILMQDIFEQATGYFIDPTKVLAFIQRAMIAIMKQLSSYSVQFITDINASKIRLINWQPIRPGDLHGENNHNVIARPSVNVYDYHNTTSREETISLLDVSEVYVDTISEDMLVNYDVSIDNTMEILSSGTEVIRLKPPYVKVSSGALMQYLSAEQINSLRI